MQTRRGFFGAACAAIAAVSGALTAVADSDVVQRTRTYIRMQYRPNTYPANLPESLRTPDVPTEFVVVQRVAGMTTKMLEKMVPKQAIIIDGKPYTIIEKLAYVLRVQDSALTEQRFDVDELMAFNRVQLP